MNIACPIVTVSIDVPPPDREYTDAVLTLKNINSARYRSAALVGLISERLGEEFIGARADGVYGKIVDAQVQARYNELTQQARDFGVIT